jgi:hypothetical protein
MGGVFNSINLNMYHYSGLNPVLFTDPDGKAYLYTHGYGAKYVYRAESKGTEFKDALWGCIPIVGNWSNEKVAGPIMGFHTLKNNKISNSVSSTIDVVSVIKKFGNVAKAANWVGLLVNTYSLGSSFAYKYDKVEYAIEKLGLVKGDNKEFLMSIIPFVEKRVKELIKDGSIKMNGQLGDGNYGYWITHDEKKINELRSNIKEMKKSWMKQNKSKNK